MIIVYNSAVAVIPEDSMWMIRTEWSEEEDCWALVLAVDGETMDTILSAAAYQRVTDEGEEVGWALNLFRQITRKAAKAVAQMEDPEILDLDEIIEEEEAFWELVQEGF